MNRIFHCGLMVMVAAGSSFAGLRLSFNLGGTSSYFGHEVPNGVNVEKQGMRPALMLGGDIGVDFKELFGFSAGLNIEDKGGTIRGNIINIIRGDELFKFHYLQVPVHARVYIPLLIPGSIMLSAGPEFGFNTERSLQVTLANGSSSSENIDTLTVTHDIGISGKLGYEIPVGRYFAFSIWGGYYYGFTDILENKTKPENDINLYNRTIKYGASFIVTISEF